MVFTEQLHTEWKQQFVRSVVTNMLRGKLQAMFTGKPRPVSERRPTEEDFKRDDWVLADIYVWFSEGPMQLSPHFDVKPTFSNILCRSQIRHNVLSDNDLEHAVRVMPKKGGLDPFNDEEQEYV